MFTGFSLLRDGRHASSLTVRAVTTCRIVIHFISCHDSCRVLHRDGVEETGGIHLAFVGESMSAPSARASSPLVCDPASSPCRSSGVRNWEINGAGRGCLGALGGHGALPAAPVTPVPPPANCGGGGRLDGLGLEFSGETPHRVIAIEPGGKSGVPQTTSLIRTCWGV